MRRTRERGRRVVEAGGAAGAGAAADAGDVGDLGAA